MNGNDSGRALFSNGYSLSATGSIGDAFDFVDSRAFLSTEPFCIISSEE